MSIPATDYPFSIWQDWGNDHAAETAAEVLLWTMTPSGSVPFLEDLGTGVVEAENAPHTRQTEIVVSVEIVQSLLNYSTLAAPERRVLLTFDMVHMDRIRDGDATALVEYVRQAELGEAS